MTLHLFGASRVLRAVLVSVFSMLVVACGGTGEPETSAPQTTQVSAAQHQGGDTDICDAPPSTVLAAVPTDGGSASPINVRVHYNRPDGNYADWGLHLWQVNEAGQYVADYPGVTWPAPLARAGIDGYGAYFEIEAAKFTHPQAAGFGFIVHPPGAPGDPGIDRIWKFSDGNEFWLRSGDSTVYRSNPIGGTPDIDTVRVHYKRFDAAYTNWGVHIWPTSGLNVAGLKPGVVIDQWTNAVPFTDFNNYTVGDGEIVFDIPVLNPTGDPNRKTLEFIIHGKPPGGDPNNKDGRNDNIRVTYSALSITNRIGQIWLVQDDPTVYTSAPDTRIASTTDARAVWLTKSLVKWSKADTAGSFRLYHSATGQIVAKRGQVVSGADGSIPLALTSSVPPAAAERFKWVGAGVVLSISDDAALAAVLNRQLVLVQQDTDGKVLGATTAQIAGHLDDRFAAAEQVDDLGVTLGRGRAHFKLWAPTAQKVTLCTYGESAKSTTADAMTFDAATGVWSFSQRGERPGRYYRYAVEVFVRGVGLVRNLVTDPYAISLNTDSQKSFIADLDSPHLAPPGWKHHRSPRLPAQEDMVIYELHVRDFSINDLTVRPRHRGKYLAFTDDDSDGMRHLRRLARSGLTDVHLLPVFDIASVPEKDCVSPVIPNAAPDSPEQQAAINAVRDADCFNWGYDPWHFTAPEGSYATDADDGATRIREFRAMVMALHEAGLRVGMDVVYNHTSASGQNDKSVLDRVVPGYYHRLNASGDVERSTCCENTATENLMMGKLMIDSAKVWATQYRIDSFRFDLMAHQPRAVMEKLRDVVNAAAGREVQLIGEGWNFGEVANGARFVQASQLSLNGSGIGTFSDRARDYVRGGGPFDGGISLVKNQGYINGLFYDDNGSGAGKTKNDLMFAADLIKVGLAGSIRDYVLTTHWDAQLKLEQLDYNGQPAGYVTDPQEVVNYVENHDNQTLFDINVYKLPVGTSREDRARAQLLGAAINAFSQGVTYYHAGIDTLRSKSMDRNSYNSGDWFNRLDWTYTDNFFGTGLPPQGDNGDNWPVMQPLLANPNLKPTTNEIRFMKRAFRDLLEIRSSSKLFRLRTAEEIKQRLTFFNTGSTQIPTVLAGHLNGASYQGAGFAEVLYFVNVDKVPQTLTIDAQKGKRYALHPVHRDLNAGDPRAATATYDAASGSFTLPARTAVVFVVR
jgi:pullulanase/glycogen debranching enzyme